MAFINLMNILTIFVIFHIYVTVGETNSALFSLGDTSMNAGNGLVEKDDSLLVGYNQINLNWTNIFNRIKENVIKDSGRIIDKHFLSSFKTLLKTAYKSFDNQGNATEYFFWLRCFFFGLIVMIPAAYCIFQANCCYNDELTESQENLEITITDQDITPESSEVTDSDEELLN